jgi:glutamate dehydrogenase (NAD(P)+)
MIANDYLVNSGGVIYAAQEHLIPTPAHLQLPGELLGQTDKVDAWLKKHTAELAELSEERREAGVAYREGVIRRNMTELVDLLASDADLLPSKAAEQISLQRLAEKESRRTAGNIMEPMPTIGLDAGMQEAAELIVKSQRNIVGVLGTDDKLAGVVTTWDITRATAQGVCDERVASIMTRDVVAAAPDFSILEIVRELEHHRISAMPVVADGAVLGMVTSDLLAQRYLLQLLRAREG